MYDISAIALSRCLLFSSYEDCRDRSLFETGFLLLLFLTRTDRSFKKAYSSCTRGILTTCTSTVKRLYCMTVNYTCTVPGTVPGTCT